MFRIREANRTDSSTVFDLIKKLAQYEKLSSEVTTSLEELESNIFDNKYAEVLIAEVNQSPVGFALYFFNFSTFVGKPGLYLEDLYIEPEHRGNGYGKNLLIHLASIATKKNCGRMEWSVLDWNAPSIAFYKSLGAKPMDEWSVYRLDQMGIKELANSQRT